ncbi:hypothetical protein GCM10010412_091770 [Nonomuraea recticatena]|uniref:Winged helix-turn helix domain-containing protein n=2 Tax=Nonomuraea recticatena TaxID=46178 RepID=A0ABN3TBM7_9ACTN
MRYPDGGGLPSAARAKREQVRLQGVIRCRRGTGAGGQAAESVAEVFLCLVSSWQAHALDAGPAAHGWAEDQRWTLARVTALIEQLFRVSYTLRGTSYLLHRLGWSPQMPQRRAAERDEDAVATWIKETWPTVERPPGTRTHGSASKTRQASR